MKIYTSLSFGYLFSKPKSNGFMNQIQSLLHAFQIAKFLNRDLVVDGFYPDFESLTLVPLSSVFDMSTLPGFVEDGFKDIKPTKSKFLRDFCNPSTKNWANRILRYENHILDLFLGCCFYYRFDTEQYLSDLRRLRFHPFFYSHIQPFLDKYPFFHSVHFRVENDFTQHFFQKFGFTSPKEMEIFIKNSLQSKMNSTTPHLILTFCSNPPDGLSSVELKNLSIFQDYFNLDISRMREVFALVDFLLSTSDQCKAFIGVEESSFSQGISVCRNQRTSHLISVRKPT
jgi:hypothetical protein